MAEILKVIGLMSGTSLDGVDAALLETDGQEFVRPGPSLTMPYSDAMRARLRDALDAARTVPQGGPVPESIREAGRHLTEAHAKAVQALLEQTERVLSAAPERARRFLVKGTQHTLGSIHTTRVGDESVGRWLTRMLAGDPDWKNVLE